jgi:hypothetical protein
MMKTIPINALPAKAFGDFCHPVLSRVSKKRLLWLWAIAPSATSLSFLNALSARD